MSGPVLRYATHWSSEHPFTDDGASSALERFRDGLGGQIRAATKATGLKPVVHAVCSTIISSRLTSCSRRSSEFLTAVSTGAQGWPTPFFVSAYECASWGFVLRHLSKIYPGTVVAVSVADIDIHGFSYWQSHPLWERSGFGATTLLLELAEDNADEAIAAGSVRSSNTLLMYGRAVQKFSASRTVPVFIPFFPSATRDALDRIAEKQAFNPNGHARYGHCFGSDPWIGLIDHVTTQPNDIKGAIVTSLALNGYYTIAHIEIAKDFKAENVPWPKACH